MKINKNYFLLTSFLLLNLTLMFVRSFTGIYLFGFRIGEFYIGFCFLVFLFILADFVSKKYNYFKIDNQISIILAILFFLFLVSFIDLHNFKIDPYFFRTSSYIWSISFFYLGVKFYKDTSYDKYLIYSFSFLIIFLYILIVIYRPQIFAEFFLNFSDKYELHKGADVVLIFVLFSSIFFKKIQDSKFNLFLLIIVIGFYMPLILAISRTAFVAALLLVVFNLKRFNFLIKDKIKLFITGLLLVISFNTSLHFIGTSSVFLDDYIRNELSFSDILDYRNDKFYENKFRDEGMLPFLFINESRLYSGDGNLNWRFQIWQDVIFDVDNEAKTLLFGYGYKEIIPAMTLDIERRGNDGLNETVHNYIINILARGGLVQILLFLYLNYCILRMYFSNHGNYKILIYMLPLLIVSMFDGAMENAHYSLIYYFFLGRLINIEY